MTTLIGTTLGRYHLLEQLGEGGMATVYKAFDTQLERDVAVKVILQQKQSSEKLLARFKREAKALAQLSHPNIVKVLDYGEHDGTPYLVMEYISGGTLKQRLGKPLPHIEAAALLAPIARALECAHQHKIVHRDIKPANILLSETGVPMLSDFGIAKLLQEEETMDLTGTGVGVGTPEYMSPEQGLGKGVDHRADIYALGIVFYELITGRKPFKADTPMAVVIKQINDPLPRPKQFVNDVPEQVERVIFKALAKKPEDRFQEMGAFVSVLEGLAQGRKVSVGKVARAPGGVLRLLPLAIGGMIIVVLVGTLLWLSSRVRRTQAYSEATALYMAQIAAQTANAPSVTPQPTSTIDLFVAATELVRATQVQKTVVAATYYAQRTINALTPSKTPTITRTRTPTNTPFPTSIPVKLFVLGYVQGTEYVANATGVHRLTFVSGSYQYCPSSYGKYGCGTWLAGLTIFKNRNIAWASQPNSYGFYDMGQGDFYLGVWDPKATASEAEATSVGKFVDIPLSQNDYLWIIPGDCRDCYNDNSGGVSLTITIIRSLP